MSEHEVEGYAGSAELSLEGVSTPVPVQVTLRGLFQPIDGRYHWYGRISQHADFPDLVTSGASVVLRTPEGAASGRLSDRDAWGRYRIAGTGRPPFRLEDAESLRAR